MMLEFAIVGWLSIVFGLFFMLGRMGGRATAVFSLGRSSLTFRATLGAVFIFIGFSIMLMGGFF